ncbi:MAG: uracil phosphoribosyltransferase [Prevotella sp.]|nr:uracil phosphoribosyltransferase [Prevotella sp.]
MNVINLEAQPTIANQFLAELRDVDFQRNRTLFRRNIKRIGAVLAYEISRELTYSPKQITTPLGTATVLTPASDIVVATVLRAGVSLQEGFMEVFDRADAAFVSAYRYYTDEAHTEVGIKTEYLAAPPLEGKTLILADPMLATGGSIDLALTALTAAGMPRRIFIACVIAAQEGIDFLQHTPLFDSVTLYTATIDPELNEAKYIVPGLGDAGDLCFGEKI